MSNFKPFTKLTSTDWLLEGTSFLVIVISWWYLLSNFAEIPETIPVHFNLKGIADRFGDKGELMNLQYVATGLYLLLEVLGLFPQLHNIPNTLTEENTKEKRRLSGQMMRWINLIISLIFAVLVITSVYNALNDIQNQNAWIVLLLVAVLTAVVVKYWSKLAKK